MHAIKGGWIGQTFALAKPNDSGGRKSRIRRSKEERKAMVESFIKKYMKSNDGNFPSLNLTHKEVGGSFYTVREIVREIIQENRVLGPAKFTPEELNNDRFFEQYPLGSISTEPQSQLSVLNETHILLNHHQGTSEALVLNSNGQDSGPEHDRFDMGKIINGSGQAVEKDKRNDEEILIEPQAGKSLELEEGMAEVVEASKDKITHITSDVVVETFPLRSVPKMTYDLGGKSSELKEFTGTLEENEIEKVGLGADNNNPVLERMNSVESSNFFYGKAEVSPADSLLERNSVVVEETAVGQDGDELLENSNGPTTKEVIVLDASDDKNLEVKDFSASGIKSILAPEGNGATKLDNSDSSSSCGQSISKDANMIKTNLNIQHGGSLQEESKPSLDRINLESWEGTMEKSARPETNPLLMFFKSFIAAFVKFWSE